MTDLGVAAANTIIVNLYERIGQRTKESREARGFTQQQLARAIGLTRASVGNIEAGHQRPQLHILIAIAQALGLSLFDLLGDGELPALAPVLPAPTTQLRTRLTEARNGIDALLRALPTGAQQ
ncbi:hypothetical protein GCM10010193_69600 [Kitasatospora atroaurantiaca]|uniref:DNA-binding XRE family transcriptional regulator n=1 Tax=Kitasatospora atroaurantiaca TaxID=285545 RepID=A0A561EN52_9ACTN|nr:helix-turn-helix transcriptional regulator [Kitasatospora atroaurantiaca]TWE17045.1 DNA-binding XRE family transcriptional regulator [Kitasatospora atroaurantiaca]